MTRAVVIVEGQRAGTFMAYRIEAAEFRMRRHYPADVDPFDLPTVPTRVTFEGWLIDGRLWTPPAEFFAEPDAIAPTPPPIERGQP